LASWDVEGLNFICELGRRFSTISGDPREKSFLLQRLSVAVQRRNAIAFRGTFPEGQLDEDTVNWFK